MVAERVLQQQLLDEKCALATVRHPFICDFFGTYKNAQALYLVLELCDGPELYAVLQEHGRFGKDFVQLYAACLFSALAELHSRKWMFRDLKAENVVFAASGAVKLVDFGLAVRVPEGTKLFTVCGSTEYMAPEVVDQVGYDCGADWWSFGCLLYEMSFGCTPWIMDTDGVPNYGLSDTDISKRIVDPARELVFPNDLEKPPSPLFLSLITRLLQRKDTLRIGCGNAGAEAIRSHQYFDNMDWTALCAGTIAFPPVPEVRLSVSDTGDDSGIVEQAPPEPVDPISAQLMKFMQQRAAASAEGTTGAEGPQTAQPAGEAEEQERKECASASSRTSAQSTSTSGRCNSKSVSAIDNAEEFWVVSVDLPDSFEKGNWDRDF